MRTNINVINIEVQKKQVNAVLDLITVLNRTKFNINFWTVEGCGGGGTSEGIYYNIFEVANFMNTKEISKNITSGKEFDDAPVLFYDSTLKNLNFADILNNSHIPRTIADELLNFHVSYWDETNLFTQKEELQVVLIGSEENRGRIKETKQINSFGFKSWLNFKRCAFKLQNEIQSFLKACNVSDLNIRLDYKEYVYYQKFKK